MVSSSLYQSTSLTPVYSLSAQFNIDVVNAVEAGIAADAGAQAAIADAIFDDIAANAGFPVSVTDALQAGLTTDVGAQEAIALAVGTKLYADRAAALAAIPGLSTGVNRIGWIAPDSRTYFVYRLVVSTAISDMLGWYPEGAITPFHFGAIGDGTVDDTVPCQKALNTGRNVEFPKPTVRYRVTDDLIFMANDQRVYSRDGAEIRQVTTGKLPIRATGKIGVGIFGLTLYATGETSSYVTGCGALFIGCSLVTARGVTVKNHRGGGIVLHSTNNSSVMLNKFRDSPVSEGGLDSQARSDVAVINGSTGNKVIGNDCMSGQGTAILIQSVLVSEASNQNIAAYNTVDGYKTYGICAYRNDQLGPVIDQYVLGTIIANNTVRNISGTTQNSITLLYPYGAGIYVQGAEGTAVTGNTVEFTHTGGAIISPAVFDDLLTPAAIGFANVTRFTCTGNTVNDCEMFGIEISSSLLLLDDSIGFGLVSGNAISRVGTAGIRSRNKSRVLIIGNGIDTTGAHGIRIQNTYACFDIIVVGNATKNTTNNGIDVAYVTNCSVLSNIVNGSAVHGFAAANCNNLNANDNNISNHVNRGMNIASTCVGVSVLNNSIVGNGTSLIGILIDAKATIGNTNRISGCVTRWSGTHALLRGSNTVTTVNNSTTVETTLVTITLPANTFADSNDTMKMSAIGSSLNNANVKTIRVKVGGVTVLTATLTASQISPWRLEMEMFRGGVNLQRCFTQLVQGGTVSKLSADIANPNVSDTAAIVITITAQGTASSDVSCFTSGSTFSLAA